MPIYGLMLVLLVGLSIGCVREPTLDVEKWRAINDSTLKPRQRIQLLHELTSEREFIRARLSRAIELLGQPDYMTGDSAVYTIFESVRSNDSLITLRLKFKLSDDSIITKTIQEHNVNIVPAAQ